MKYFFNTEDGMLRACAYWVIKRPADIHALYDYTNNMYKRSFIVTGKNRQELLGKLVIVSSLGFRIQTVTRHNKPEVQIVRPGMDGADYFRFSYAIAVRAVRKEGEIDPRKIVMWKHRAYFQAISTLQMYASDFRELTKGLETVPDVPGWLLTGMKNMRLGTEDEDVETSIALTVSVCQQELTTEKEGYEAALVKRDLQIDELTRTIADMTRGDKRAVILSRDTEQYKRNVADKFKELDDMFTDTAKKLAVLTEAVKDAGMSIPTGGDRHDSRETTAVAFRNLFEAKRRERKPISIPKASPPVPPPAPPAPVLSKNIQTGEAAIRRSLSVQERDRGSKDRVQDRGSDAVKDMLADIRKGGFGLKAVPKRDPKTATKAAGIQDALAAAIAARAKAFRDSQRGDVETDLGSTFALSNIYTKDEEGDVYFASEIGSIFHPLNEEDDEGAPRGVYEHEQERYSIRDASPQTSGGDDSTSEWKTRMNDIFS